MIMYGSSLYPRSVIARVLFNASRAVTCSKDATLHSSSNATLLFPNDTVVQTKTQDEMMSNFSYMQESIYSQCLKKSPARQL
jgi:hypothetical protein